MKKDNIWRIMWMAGIVIVLFIILYLVVEYKVKWENRDLSDYLYFYNCSGNLCTSSEKVDTYYSKVKCTKDKCPYIKEKENNLLVLHDNNKEYIYDYQNDTIINNTYMSYSFVNNGYIVMDNSGKYGIIDRAGETITELKYNQIVDYKNGYIVYTENGKKGIINEEKNIDIKPTYNNIILINDRLYAYKEENKYYIATYDTELPVNNTNYDYLYDINDNSILVIKDKKLDIIDNNFKSLLILKLDTYYSYEREQERNSLSISKEGNLLRFTIVQSENELTNYFYDIKGKKLYS